MNILNTIIAEMRERTHADVHTIDAWADRLAALPQGEAVAWLCDGPYGKTAHVSRVKVTPEAGCTWTPLYTAPPAPVVSDAMVDRAVEAMSGVRSWSSAKDYARKLATAALEAAFLRDNGVTP